MNNNNALLSASEFYEVPFHDCDPMQVVWHGNYARYLELARCKLLRLFNYDYNDMYDSGYMWPIIDMRIKYVGATVFTQQIKIEAFLKEYEQRLKIDYIISDAQTGKKLTKATTTQVAVCMQSKEMQFESPAVLLTKIAKVL
ncbi:acyl-CoA thioesterase [Colwellia asteriadis]|uniref:Acyl-CoA thioesterase n=1 Tax=Colwellia asteriadis TaxID=517723 RepID=A0ABN1L777_9GAMM